jgi:hypothetical protein
MSADLASLLASDHDRSVDDDIDDDDTIVGPVRGDSVPSRRFPARVGVTVEQFRSRMRRESRVDDRGDFAAVDPRIDDLDDSGVAVFHLVRIGADVWVKLKR